MCGIAGFASSVFVPEADRGGVLASMLAAIAHRGPDDEGSWFDETIAIGHRRLSILDLSPLGHQPMVSACGRYVLSFNGEIYNHLQLRKQLQQRGHRFKGRSDTEVLLSLVTEVGLCEALRRCVGMFAIALWDRSERRLQLARDRFGEKPLYYGVFNGSLIFGSELRALRQHPGFDSSLDPQAVLQLLEFGYIATPRSVYRHVSKVPVGSILSWRMDVAAADDASARMRGPTMRRYWDLSQVVLDNASRGSDPSFTEAADRLDDLLRESVALQMQADVPLGAFLSGGVDSSLVVALMQTQSSHRTRTFTIGFEDPTANEADHARLVAAHLGTSHTECRLDRAEAVALIPHLADVYDEPLADSSQIPTLMVSKLARASVTVSLSGDGGDELFGGYRKYRLGERISAIPRRRMLGRLASSAPRPLIRLLGRTSRSLRPVQFQRAAYLFGAPSSRELWLRLSAVNPTAAALLDPDFRKMIADGDSLALPVDESGGFLRTAMTLDSMSYLPDDVLTKVDRASMSVGLESRAPILDHRVAEFAAGLPDAYLVDGDGGKRLLRHVLYRHVPRALVDRPKQGFCLPLGHWLRTNLRDWAHAAFAASTEPTGVLDLGACRALLDQHIVGDEDLSPQLWAALTLQAWLGSN